MVFQVEHADSVRRATGDVRGLAVPRDDELVSTWDRQPPEDLARSGIERDDLVRGVAGDVEGPSSVSVRVSTTATVSVPYRPKATSLPLRLACTWCGRAEAAGGAGPIGILVVTPDRRSTIAIPGDAPNSSAT
jgi:hypothetical protein